MTDMQEQFTKVKNELLSLRAEIPALLDDQKYLYWFDEFLSEYEFGLALGMLCDFLLEPKTPPVNGEILERIKKLHAMMKLENDDIDRLKQKTNFP